MNLQFFDAVTGKSDNPVWIGHVRLGMVVQDTEFEDGVKTPIDRYGHITGFTRNILGGRILIVQWENGEDQNVHSGNVILLR